MNTKLDTIMAAWVRLSAGPEPPGDRVAAAAATSDAPASAAAQQHDRGAWASAGPSTDASRRRMQRLSSGTSGPCGRRLRRRTRPRLQRRGADLRGAALVGFDGDQSTNNVILRSHRSHKPVSSCAGTLIACGAAVVYQDRVCRSGLGPRCGIFRGTLGLTDLRSRMSRGCSVTVTASFPLDPLPGEDMAGVSAMGSSR